MTHDELVEVGAQALSASLQLRQVSGTKWPIAHTSAGIVIDAVESLIRADERERHTVNNPLLLADIRAQVRALDHPDYCTSWAADMPCICPIRDVLVILDRAIP